MIRQVKTHTCHMCKLKMPALEALQYKDNYWYCKTCFTEKANREWFASQVCAIFGLKAPGQRLYADRKRLQDTYGYTDRTIIDTLKYAINDKHIQPKTISLGLVTPALVDEMSAKQRALKREAEIAGNMVSQTEIVPSVKKRIVSFNDADHPIRTQIKLHSTWDDLLGEEEYE